jgi:hypothetical protein
MQRAFPRLLLAATLAAGAGQAGAVNLLTDNFDSYALGLGLTSVGDWRTSSTVVGIPLAGSGGGVDVIGSVGVGAPSYDFYPGNGNYIDLDGTAPSQGPTFFYRDVSLAAAASTYSGYTGQWTATLNFDIGQNPNGAAGRQVVAYIAGAAPGSSVFSTSALTAHSRTLTFSGAIDGSWSYRIGFYTPSGDAQGPILDNVSFNVAPVPEPHEWAMMLAGLGIVGWAARRARRDGTGAPQLATA